MNSHYTFSSKQYSSRTGYLQPSNKQVRSTGTLSSSNQMLQRKIRIGSANDPMEAEADRAANAVLSGNEATISSRSTAAPVQRKCTQCGDEESATIQRQPTDEEELGTIRRQSEEEEEELQAKPAEGGLIQRQPEEEEEELLQPKAASGGTCSACASKSGDSAASAVSSGGRPLSESDRSYFEPRFGRDFSDVRVHTHSTAENAAGNINAKAFTLGNNIAFGSGQFSPNSAPGRHLLAHELAHVVQQKGGGQNTVRRTVSRRSRCPASIHGAPANPTAALETINTKALIMSHIASLGLTISSGAPHIFPHLVTAYKGRFGNPPASGRRFRNRFNRRRYRTRDAALAAEMNSASSLFSTITNRLGRPIRYRCPGTSSVRIENCRPFTCASTTVAGACPGTNMRDMIICPGFWGLTDEKQKAGALIHEVVHARLNRPGHPQNVNRRHRNPECFTSFIADTNGFTPFDTRCPKIP